MSDPVENDLLKRLNQLPIPERLGILRAEIDDLKKRFYKVEKHSKEYPEYVDLDERLEEADKELISLEHAYKEQRLTEVDIEE
jgi:hypothetical protein